MGQANRFAHAAAMAVAEQPAGPTNPLFIYGDSGLGRPTCCTPSATTPVASCRYPGPLRELEEFTNDFINSIRDHGRVDFHRRYRDVDVLLVDDIQFLSGVQTQESSSTPSTRCTTPTSRS